MDLFFERIIETAATQGLFALLFLGLFTYVVFRQDKKENERLKRDNDREDRLQEIIKTQAENIGDVTGKILTFESAFKEGMKDITTSFKTSMRDMAKSLKRVHERIDKIR